MLSVCNNSETPKKRGNGTEHNTVLGGIINPLPVSLSHAIMWGEEAVVWLTVYLQKLLAQNCHQTNYVTVSVFDMVIPWRY
jgi:hypothetical protein